MPTGGRCVGCRVGAVTPSQLLSDVMNDARLTFDRMVPRGLVHKQAIEEVLLCDYTQLDTNEYLVAAQLPRCHTYFNDVSVPYYDFTAVAEVTRQAGLLTGHCFHDVPTGTQYIFRKVSANTEHRNVEAMRIGDSPTDLLVHYSIRNPRLRRGRLTSFEALGEIYANGAFVNTGYAFCQLLPPDTYHSLRTMMREPDGHRESTTEPDAPERAGPRMVEPVEPLEPSLVGRRDVRNVVIGAFARGQAPDVYTATLVVRPDHRVFFDHHQDHVPGPLLIEAVRQLALRAACEHHDLDPQRVYIGTLDIEFSSFAELDAPTTGAATVGELEQRPDSRQVVVEVAITQSDTTATHSTLTVTALD
jgi:2-oxo-3-(phosphooxy)propyl 3-oxoalkanoate synthase